MSTRRCVLCAREFEAPLGDTSSTTCPECYRAAWEGGQAALSQESAKSPSFPVTIALIAINALVFAIMVLRGVTFFDPTPQQAIAFGADFGPLTLNGQWWRLVTSMFVHFGIIHIGLNMWCLWNLGRAAEVFLGRFSYLLAYFASGIFGSIASVYWHPLAAGAGASGAIFGMAGVLVTFVYLKKTPAHLQINKKMLSSLGTFIFYNLVIGASIPGISNAAHVGGLVMGAVVGALLPAAGASESSRRTRLSFVVAFCAASLFGSGAAAKHLRSRVAELPSIRRLIAQGKSDEAIARLQEITAREPQFAAAHDLLASLYLSGGDYPKAISALEKANASDPSNTTYQRQLGSAYLATKQFDQAAVLFEKLVHASPSDARNYLGLGTAYMGIQQYDAAISAFSEASARDPKSPAPQFALGQAQLKAGRFADAKATYQRLVAEFPNDPRARLGLDYASRQNR
jgi:membrane associated rhomboid family serine protease/Flp pilus assembly protein TadD